MVPYWQYRMVQKKFDIFLKEPGPIASDLFKLSEILVSEESSYHIFLITPGEFDSWKIFCLEDINENMTCYGNQN